jgi:acyl-coenzyme A synthetase/AMP-(fatty) acid ligase
MASADRRARALNRERYEYDMDASNTRDRKVTVAALLAAAIAAQPARPALHVAGDAYTYRDLRQRTIDYQEFARRNCISSGDRVMFLGEPGLDLYACLLAGVLGSYTASLGSMLLSAQARASVIRRVDPRLIITQPGSLPQSTERMCLTTADVRACSGADLDPVGASHAFLSITSGTTGQPTLALVDAQGLAGFCQWAFDEIDLASSDRWFEASDPSADLAITNALLAFTSGACLVVPARRHRLRFATLAAAHDTTIMRMVPSAGDLMLVETERRQALMPKLRVLAFGGDELPVCLPARMLRAFQSGARALNTYGMTESAGFLLFHWFDACQPPTDSTIGSVPLGQPISGVRAWIDHSGEYPAAAGDQGGIGELIVKGATVALEIAADGEPRSVLRKPAAGAEGELRTGDLVRQDGDNFIFLGRTGRIVNIHGVRINLAQLDQLASGLLERNVCMLKHGNGLVALVESQHQVSPSEVIRRIAGTLYGPLIPGYVVTVPELPRTHSGKISISECAEIARHAMR